MFGLNKFEIKQKIKSKLFSLTVSSQNSELKNLAGRIAEGVAEAMEANNRKIENEIESRLRDLRG